MSAGAAVEFCMSCEMELKVHGEKRAVESPGSQADSPGDSAGRFSPHYGGGTPYFLIGSMQISWVALEGSGGFKPPKLPRGEATGIIVKTESPKRDLGTLNAVLCSMASLQCD